MADRAKEHTVKAHDATQSKWDHRVGDCVEYWSQSSQQWIPAVVEGYDEAAEAYRLDVQPMAFKSKVRACNGTKMGNKASCTQSSTGRTPWEHKIGDHVEYWSQSSNRWLPAVVQGYDESCGAYCLDVQPMAFPNKVRAAKHERAREAHMEATASASSKRPVDASVNGQRPGTYSTPLGPALASVREPLRRSPSWTPPPCETVMGTGSKVNMKWEHAVGDRVEYWSQSANRWVPATVEGYDEAAGAYRLDLQPMAFPNKVRRSTAHNNDPTGTQIPQGGRSATPPPLRKAPATPQAAGGAFSNLVAMQTRMASETPQFANGVAVEYYSSSRKQWLAAVVQGYDAAKGHYVLDIQPAAAPGKVRLPLGTKDNDDVLGNPFASTKVPPPRVATASPMGTVWPGSGLPSRETPTPFFDCIICGCACRKDLGIELDCKHKVCSTCLVQHLESKVMAQQVADSDLLCPKCRREITLTPQIRELFEGTPLWDRFLQLRMSVQEQQDYGGYLGSQTSVQSSSAAAATASRRRANASRAPLFQCPICFDEEPLDNGMELDCHHKLCKSCFRSYLESKISEAQVTEKELVCPIPSCSCEITVPQVAGTIEGTDLWQKFLDFRMNAWQPDEGERVIDCPTPDCVKFVAPVDMKFVQCPTCKKQFCQQCREEKHEGVSCESLRAWKAQNAHADQDFEQLMANQLWRRCPVCGVPSERESGCNFMQCNSQQCRKNTYWCYICGKQFPRDAHYKHYPKGPYQNECLTPESEYVKRDAVPVNMLEAYFPWFRRVLEAVGAA